MGGGRGEEGGRRSLFPPVGPPVPPGSPRRAPGAPEGRGALGRLPRLHQGRQRHVRPQGQGPAERPQQRPAQWRCERTAWPMRFFLDGSGWTPVSCHWGPLESRTPYLSSLANGSSHLNRGPFSLYLRENYNPQDLKHLSDLYKFPSFHYFYDGMHDQLTMISGEYHLPNQVKIQKSGLIYVL